MQETHALQKGEVSMSHRQQDKISWTDDGYPYAYFTVLWLCVEAVLLLLSFLITLFLKGNALLSWRGLWWSIFQVGPISIVFWIAFTLWKTTSMTIFARKQDNAHYLEHLIRKQTIYLLYWREKAQWENARKYLWKRRHLPEPQPTITELCQTLPITKYSSWSSWYFTVLSSYLQLPLPEPGMPWVEGSLVVIREQEQESPAIEQGGSAIGTTHLPVQVPFLALDREPPPYALLLLDEMKLQVRFENLSMTTPLKSAQQQEVLAYLALVATEKMIQANDLRSTIYEEIIGQDEDAEQTQYKLYNDTKSLRAFFHAFCKRANIPYINPIETEKGKNAPWRLNTAYVPLDIARMKELAQRLPELKQQPAEVDKKAVRTAYEGVIDSFGSGLLGHLKRSGRIGSWIGPYFNRYQEMYRQLLWDIAEWEERGSQISEPEEQEECLRRAAQWYERCALAHIPTQEQNEEGWPAGQAHIGELALQRSMEFYGQLKETIAAERIFTTYRDRILALNENYSIEKPTNQMYKRVTGSTQQ